MQTFSFLAATIAILALNSATAFADTHSSDLTLSVDSQSSTSSLGGSATVVNTSTQQTEIGATIGNNGFSPATMTIPQGTTVTWTNRDTTAHTVTGNTSNGLASGLIQPGQSYSFTFSTPGTFAYHCSIHPEMTGSVTVTASQPSPSASSPSGAANGTQPPTNSPATGGEPNTSSANEAPSSSSMPATTNSTVLPDTGPSNIAALFVVPAFLGICLAYLRIIRHAKRPA